MSAFRPGVGDPLGTDNMDGRPNWQLQSKARNTGPPSYLSRDFSVQPHTISRYAEQLPELYRVNIAAKDDVKMIGRRHFEQHLKKTDAERVDRGVCIPDHLYSGYDRPAGMEGKAKVEVKLNSNPKTDGGVWEPVRKNYPKAPEKDRGQGCRIVEKPVPNNPTITLRPVTLTIKDSFKPGGVQIFQGKRDTNPHAFPNARGYTLPKNFDETGARIDYSSIEHGGTFGLRMCHGNQPVPVPKDADSAWRQDSSFKSRAKHAESILLPPPPRPSASGRSISDSAAAQPPAHRAPSAHPAPQPSHGPAAPPGAPAAQARPQPGPASIPPTTRAAQHDAAAPHDAPTHYVRPGRQHNDMQLRAATSWTCFGGYRP